MSEKQAAEKQAAEKQAAEKSRAEKPTAEKPLAGLKVVEMSTMITCSLAAMMMRSQGAEVVKVEPVLIGDPMRFVGSMKNGQSALFHNCNRGKRSLAIDLKHQNGIEAVKRLAAQADVMLNNYRPGVMDGLGLGPDIVRGVNPRLVNVAVTEPIKGLSLSCICASSISKWRLFTGTSVGSQTVRRFSNLRA